MKKTLIIIISNVLCLVVFLALQGAQAGIVAPLHAERAADAWAGQSGERFAQLSVFFPYTYEFNEEKIHSLRASIDNALLAVSLEDSAQRRLYADAWSAQGNVFIMGAHGTAGAPAIGVGGDFFLFHPLYLRSGSYISPNDVMRDRVVLDEELAWRLYGSMQLAGLEVEIGGKPFVIAGVVSREKGFAYSHALGADKAYEGGAGLYMSYEALSSMTEDGARIDCYEIVMPDVVTDFAVSTLETALSNETLQVVENSSRFDYANLFKVIGSFGQRSMHTEPIALPYWENAMRYAEDWLALLLLISLAALVFPVVCAVFYGVKLIRFGIKKCKDGIRALLKKREDKKYARYIQRHGERDAVEQDTL